ncbi:MAG: hypothetical protein ABL892_03855 [Thiobacillaceae bacterium]
MGVALHYLGRDREAAEKLGRSLAANNGEASLYTAFWQHIVAKRSGTVPSALETQLNAVTGREWPYPVAEMLLGRISPDKLLEAAVTEDKGVQRDQLCEAFFISGRNTYGRVRLYRLEHRLKKV